MGLCDSPQLLRAPLSTHAEKSKVYSEDACCSSGSYIEYQTEDPPASLQPPDLQSHHTFVCSNKSNSGFIEVGKLFCILSDVRAFKKKLCVCV